MRLTARDPRFVVLDDVFDPDDFGALWRHVQQERYTAPHNDAGAWVKVWRLNDGFSVVSSEYVWSRRPGGPALDMAAAAFIRAAALYPEVGGAEGKDWSDLVLTCHLYPRGAKLNWHRDRTNFRAAVIYYAHPHWSAAWGGELLIADEQARPDARPPEGSHLDHSAQDANLMEVGCGRYVAPRSNRLVLLRGGAPHMLARIDADAGDHVRCSISGFFMAPADD